MPRWTQQEVERFNARTLKVSVEAPAPSKSEQREVELHEEILDECRSRGWKAFHGSMAHRTHRTVGEPDFIIAIEHGSTLYVEAKTGHGKLSLEQQAVRAHLHKLGHTLHVVRSIHEFRALAEMASDAATYNSIRKIQAND